MLACTTCVVVGCLTTVMHTDIRSEGTSGGVRGRVNAGAAANKPRVWGSEAWSKFEDVKQLGDLEYRISPLPVEGKVAVVPWAGSNYPMYLDSINYLWAGAGTESAAQTYQRAFGGEGIKQAVSNRYGVVAYGKECRTHADCGHN